jgi:hypothetical protein
MKFILSVFTILTLQTSFAFAELCADKKKQYGKNFISCNEVDWGVKPISADYQPTNFGPMTAKPSQSRKVIDAQGTETEVKYENSYPGIKNTEFYHETSDTPLATKFYTAMAIDPKVSVEDPSLAQWLAKDWFNGQQPKSESAGWDGKCGTWAAWSMDPELQKLFAGIRDGILCNGIPFSKGELKEIVTSLYPEPMMERKRFNKFYIGYSSAADETEDANVALSKLGMFGQGELGPAEVLSLARTAKQNGQNMMMDRDPGFEIWNQPIQKITDVAFTDIAVDEWKTLTSAEFSAGSNQPEQITFLSDLATLESELTQNLLKGRGIDQNKLCTLRSKLGENCSDLTAKLTMSEQVDVLNRLKQSAFNRNMIQLKQDVSIVKHEMIIEYGVENSFASNAPDKTIVQSYTYTSVNSVKADGTDGPTIRSQWSPRVNSLSDICANPALAEGRNSSSLTKNFDVKQKCSQGKPTNASLASHEYFTGAVPPHDFKVFKASPQFTSEQGQQQKAYHHFLQFMAKCERFDQGVDFLKHLDQAALNNDFSAQESDSLALEYSGVKNLLDTSYIQSLLDNKYQGVQGLASLKTKLKL